MRHLDAISRWVLLTTGRSIDQHATYPVPAAANVPHAAMDFRSVRSELLIAVDHLRTILINEDDLAGTATSVVPAIAMISKAADQYRRARQELERLFADQTRIHYVAATPSQPVERRYVKPGESVLVVLPYTEACRDHGIAGRATRIRVHDSEVETDIEIGSRPVVLSLADAGVYHDLDTEGLYVIEHGTDDPARS